MEKGTELAGTDRQPYQQTHDVPLAVRFLANDAISDREVDLLMGLFEEVVEEMQRLESAATQKLPPGHHNHPAIQGEKPC